jgi:hypothetical protein
MGEQSILLGLVVHGWWKEEKEMLSAGMTPLAPYKKGLKNKANSHGF